MDIKELYKLYLQHPSIKTDTRKLEKGDLFFALKGPNFNGNHFAIQALNAGAAYVIADENLSFSDDRIIKIPDVLLTLQQLAKYHRQHFNNIPFVAITGSNGKTTTKELVHQVLSASYKTYTTEGNLNNHIGIPLTILKIKSDAEIAVIEMGANHQKEIEGYCSYAMPTHGLITNCGKAHLEGFGSEEGVRKGKGELFDFLREHNGTAFVNGDDNYIKEMSTGIKNIITYGTLEGSVTGRAVSNSSFLEVEVIKGIDIRSIKTQLVGQYNLLNVLAAVAIGKHFNIADEKIKAAIENYTPSNSRSQLITMGTNKIILDAYNANPGSMKAAIENFAQMPGTNKILFIGSMMELGERSKKEHEELIRLIEKYKWSNVILVGNNFKNIRHSYFYFDDASKAKSWIDNQQLENSQILIKGSRSMEMEKILETNSRLHTTQ
ncbi:MAG TPA: UDP-N-acetylmuramoyl-tripeptide--D-alanyl-D-alanine ligase [Chitinophagaceae bacterium]|nr:UDP-N-acetylmuramoyl-tripeptide--D-alanyl-D-alanine ligase [Chitinophagaceae bacterium]